MGCDIHAFSEKKINGKWEFQKSINIDRNYDLFSILANVRNGYGFAGVKTGEGFAPISNSKGIPHDASSKYLTKCLEWEGDGHSHSWLTLKEKKDFDWGQITMKEGIISLDEYKKIEESGEKPTSWCGGISGPNIVVVETDEADVFLSNPDTIGDRKIHVRYRWSIMYKDRATNFIEKTVPDLEKLGDTDNVRIVLFFDN